MLRREQIADIIESDNRIARRVFNQTKKWITVSNETIAPRPDIDFRAKESVERDVDRLQTLLESKLNALVLLQSQYDKSDALKTLLTTGDVAQVYNQIARVIISPQTTNTARQFNKELLNKISDKIDTIVYGILDYFRSLRQYIDDNEKQFFVKNARALLNVYVFYRIIQDQLYTGSITPITKDIIQSMGPAILASLDEPIGEDVEAIIREAEYEVRQNTELYRAYKVRVAEEEETLQRPLLPNERRRIAIQVFGDDNLPSFLSKDLDMELTRQEAEEEKHQEQEEKQQIAPLAENPNPSVVSQRLEEIANSYTNSLQQIKREFDSIKKLYRVGQQDNQSLQEDLTYLLDNYLELQEKLAVYTGEAIDPQSERDDLIERYDGLFNNPRESTEERRVFASALNDYINEYLENLTELYQYQQSQAVEEVQGGYEGFGRNYSQPFYWRNYNLAV